MNILIISSHVYTSRRRASFHWIADALARSGNNVSFLTTGLSLLSFFKNDYRLKERSLASIKDGHNTVTSLPVITIFHPVNLRNNTANKIVTPFWRLYPLQFSKILQSIQTPDLIIIESGASIALAKLVKKRFPGAALIYRVSDLLGTMGTHPYLNSEELKAIEYFSLVSVPSKEMLPHLPANSKVKIQPHGLQINLLDEVTDESPYRRGSTNVVSVGTMLFDAQTVLKAVDHFPNIDFHVFGHIDLPKYNNLFLHGEVKYNETLPFIKHASAGFAPYRSAPNASYLADTSNKMMLFRYFRKPIIAPGFVCTESWMSSYEQSIEGSIYKSIQDALSIDTLTIPEHKYISWDSTVSEMISSTLLAQR